MNEEDNPVILNDLMGSLENKIVNLSSLINKYKYTNLQNMATLEDYYNHKKTNPLRLTANYLPFQNSDNTKTDFSDDFYSCEHLDSFKNAIVEISREGYIINLNYKIEQLFRYAQKELLGKKFLVYLLPEYKTLLKKKFSYFRVPGRIKNASLHDKLVLFQCYAKNGKVISLEGQFSDSYQNQKASFSFLLREITSKNRSKLTAQQFLSDKKIHHDYSDEAIFRIDKNFDILYSNSGVKNIFGFTSQEVRGENLNKLFPPEILKYYEKDLLNSFFSKEINKEEYEANKTIEILGIHKNRGISPMEITLGDENTIHGNTLTCKIRDISTRKNTEQKLHKLAYFDKLTNLGNRDLFTSDIQNHLEKIKNNYDLSSLMFLDLDGFKDINDNFGHNAGDILLKETAKRLNDCLRDSDSVYRLGGDEFIVLLRKINEKNDASIVAKNILNTIRMPYYLKTGNKSASMVNIGVSIGILLISELNLSISEITKKADLAMYASKKNGKNRYTFFSDQMVAEVNQRRELGNDLKKAILSNTLELHYQPIVNELGQIQGLEALLRWNHPILGNISPEKFIPLAEESNLIIPLGKWVLEKSCTDITYWNNNGFEKVYVSVNFSSKQFEHQNAIEMISSIIKKTHCNPANFKIELAEITIMQSPEEIIKKINTLKSQFPELQIIIDDFGTGYSSMNYLANLPTDVLKIDLSFVKEINDHGNKKVINSIINLANSLGMQYIAEGIETENAMNYFIEKKCNLMQGFYFSKALSKNKISTLLNQIRL